MNKTPVSILQEMMVKKRMIPDYVLIHDGGGTHVNTFTYRVSCEGLSATGTGRSKKDAKHEAAKAMLETIAAHRGYPQLPASPAQSPTKSTTVVPAPSRVPPNVPFVNAIGALQSLCAENSLEDPQYIPISDEGPPHARIFTYQCVLSTFKEEGVATTKKQAKHEAAGKMLKRIRDLVDTSSFVDLEKKDSQMNISDIIAHNIAAQRYQELNKLSTKKVNLGLKIVDYHIKLQNFFSIDMCKELLENLRSIVTNSKTTDDEETVDSLLTKLRDILVPLDIEMNEQELKSTTEDIYIIAIRLITSPIIVECGFGKTANEAKLTAIRNLINTIILLLK